MRTYYHRIQKPLTNSIIYRHDVAPKFGKVIHYHPELELHLTLQGKGVRFIGDNISSFEPGDILLLGEYLPHAWHTGSDNEQGVEAIIFQFNKGFLGQEFFTLPELSHINQIYEEAKHGLLLQGNCKKEVESLMIKSTHADDFQRIIILLRILNLIAVSNEFLKISVSKSEDKKIDNDLGRLESIYAYTINNYKTEIKLTEIAEVSNLSVTSFCRYFKNLTNSTYFDYLTQFRVTSACQMLSEDRFTIDAISFECGFNNVASFYRHFKKVMGMTPVEFKKRISS